MIFEQDSVAFEILDVLYMEQGQHKTYNTKRNFAALSFRYKADTVIAYRDKKLEFTDNHICFFPPGMEYVRTTKQDVLIAVHLTLYNYDARELERFMPEDPVKYQLLFKELLTCWNRKETAYKHDAAALLSRIFAELYKDNQTEHSDSRISDSVRYIKENCLRKDFSLASAAKRSFVSETYFRKLFKQEFGISPKQYIIRSRMEYAASLILSGYYTLSEIADLCGYHDYKHFLVEFKKVKGVSPSAYSDHLTAQSGGNSNDA